MASIPISRNPRAPGRRLRGAIMPRLGLAIVSGDYRPGEVLQSEADFSAALDVSRTAFRDAIKTLSGLTPCEDIAKIRTAEPDRFIVDPIQQMPGLNA